MSNLSLFHLSLFPDDILLYIKPYISKKILVFTSRYYYLKYRKTIDSMIPEKRYEGYLRNVVRYDSVFTFSFLLKKHKQEWIKNKRIKYKNYVFDNKLFFLNNYALENNSTKCRELIDIHAKSILGKKWHKKSKLVKNIWNN